ncbi:MAG: holin family protein [Caenispirillum bisanense]|nr:holin family protein [Caenispirillum bisanense]MCA1973795.1 holin family protein [Caenispirillum sp.]
MTAPLLGSDSLPRLLAAVEAARAAAPFPGGPAEDAYVRRWRPTFGYAVALSWLVMMLAVAWVVVHEPARAPEVIAALLDTTPIWGGALAVLGLSVVKRSQDKRLPPPAAAPESRADEQA